MNRIEDLFYSGCEYVQTFGTSLNSLWEGRKIDLTGPFDSLNELFSSCLSPDLTEDSEEVPASAPATSNPPVVATKQSVSLDPKFICDEVSFQKLSQGMSECLHLSSLFDTKTFLTGSKSGNETQIAMNNKVITVLSQKIANWAENLAVENSIQLEDAYKLIIGALDKLDATRSPGDTNTFALRSATLVASQNHGLTLSSWMVYTKGGKPVDNEKWPFLDQWKNWVPEAQGAMLKFTETTQVNAKRLADKNNEQKVVFLKGGYGAGKTRLANTLFEEESTGVVSPDLGKRVVRRSMDKISHSVAHIQGSQIAYKLFDDLIKKPGMAVYDSSLSRPKDVHDYLQKCKAAQKKMVLYDVARLDVARILNVLKRDVHGDDPRIGPEFIIDSALLDKLNRVKCMEVILQDKTDVEAMKPEYHFYSGDSQGWNTESVMIIKPSQISMLNPAGEGADERLAIEGIESEAVGKTLKLVLTEDGLKAKYQAMFEKRVDQLMKELSSEERTILDEVFGSRSLVLNQVSKITDISSLYRATPASFRNALPESAFKAALESLQPDTLAEFLDRAKAKQEISYLDMPLRAALIINQNLQTSPW